MADLGSELTSEVISVTIEGAFGFGIIVVNFPAMLVYSVIYCQICSFISEYFVKMQGYYEEKIKNLESKIAIIFKHEKKNIQIIVERGGIDFTREKLQEYYDILRKYETSKRLWRITGDIWPTVLIYTNFAFSYYSVGYRVVNGLLPFEDRYKVYLAVKQLSNFLPWIEKNAGRLSSVYLSLERVGVLTEKIYVTPNNTVNNDQITRIFSANNYLILQDLSIYIGGNVLVEINKLQFKMGQKYAIIGSSGCGKSSLLSKIKGIKENGIGGEGYIYYPLINNRNPKIVMVSQQDYFFIGSSLLEVIYYPDKIPNTKELAYSLEMNTILVLLKKIQFHRTINLDVIEDWDTTLSGGEKKKIMLISSIIKNPDILILDEVFSGLDSNSIKISQNMLKEYLPDTLLLVVDHHAEHNNYNNFYDYGLYFTKEKKVVFKPVSFSAGEHTSP